MANKPKKYDINAADRRRSRMIQAGLVAIVVVFAVALGWWIMTHKKASTQGPSGGETRAISAVAPDKLIKDGAGKPKVVLSMYEDFLCPHCGSFEQKLGSTVNQLIETGAVQADYYMVALPPLDKPQAQYYSSRAGNAAYCVADADPSPAKDAFRRFHAALFAQQPGETATSFPTNDQLIETARQAGVANQALSDCINNGKYTQMVKGLVSASGIQFTPTIRINGTEFQFSDKSTPQDLINAVTKITGPVPGLTPGAPAPAPAPAAPAPAPATPAPAPATPGPAPAPTPVKP